jgi:membrane-bound serine protease (ClpP class)
MESSGLAVAFILIAMGFAILLAELIFPSGLLSVLAVACIAIGVAFAFNHSTSAGVITLIVVVVALPVVGCVLLHWWPRSPLGKRLFLTTPEEDATLASTPVNQELGQLIGRYGRAVSDLRPSGVANFDGRRVDVITEGLMVDAGQWVRCVDVQAGRVVVRPADKPDLGTLESADFG